MVLWCLVLRFIHIPVHDQAVWKTFWIIFFGAAIAADSSSDISAGLSLQPSAPKFSSTCLTVFTPGMGIAPLQMHQFMATCVEIDHSIGFVQIPCQKFRWTHIYTNWFTRNAGGSKAILVVAFIYNRGSELRQANPVFFSEQLRPYFFLFFYACLHCVYVHKKVPETWFSPSFLQSFSDRTAKTPIQEEFAGTTQTYSAENRWSDHENMHSLPVKTRVQKQ